MQKHKLSENLLKINITKYVNLAQIFWQFVDTTEMLFFLIA